MKISLWFSSASWIKSWYHNIAKKSPLILLFISSLFCWPCKINMLGPSRVKQLFFWNSEFFFSHSMLILLLVIFFPYFLTQPSNPAQVSPPPGSLPLGLFTRSLLWLFSSIDSVENCSGITWNALSPKLC